MLLFIITKFLEIGEDIERVEIRSILQARVGESCLYEWVLVEKDHRSTPHAPPAYTINTQLFIRER